MPRMLAFPCFDKQKNVEDHKSIGVDSEGATQATNLSDPDVVLPALAGDGENLVGWGMEGRSPSMHQSLSSMTSWSA
jgi:hypothetical protein